MSQPSQTIRSIGFFSVEHSETHGWIGGYLLLNAGGRPLEFHCTLPIRPSRTQEILYGATLRSHLIGQAIPTALLKQARNHPTVICANQAEAMLFSQHANIPIVLIGTGTNRSADRECEEVVQTSHGPIITEARFAQCVQDAMSLFDDLPDLDEPFARIREAIREAQQQSTAVRAA
jgi:hypothetical protein